MTLKKIIQQASPGFVWGRYAICSYTLLSMLSELLKFLCIIFFVSFCLQKASLRWNSHTINFTHFKYTIQWFLVKLQSCATICLFSCVKLSVVSPHLAQCVYYLHPHFLIGCFQTAVKIKIVGVTRVSRLSVNLFPMRIVHKL